MSGLVEETMMFVFYHGDNYPYAVLQVSYLVVTNGPGRGKWAILQGPRGLVPLCGVMDMGITFYILRTYVLV
jgi:hypothetical protein